MNPYMNAPSGKGMMSFVMERFLVDIRRAVGFEYPAQGERKLVVAFSTSAQYYDADRRQFLVDPPAVSEKSAAASLPALCGTAYAWTRNRACFNPEPVYIPVLLDGDDGAKIQGALRAPPTQYVDLTFRLQMFERSAPELIHLQELVFAYFESNPYLFIPFNEERVEGIEDLCKFNANKCAWMSGLGDDLPGFFVKQGLPISQRLFSSDLSPSVDDVMVSETVVTIQEIPLIPEAVIARYGLLKKITVDFFALENTTVVLEDVTEIHTSLTVEEEEESE